MAFLRENEQVFNYINEYVTSKIAGTDKLAVDAETDRKAIEEANMAEEPLVRTTENSVQEESTESSTEESVWEAPQEYEESVEV